jgi:hypothetical protein
MSRTARIVRDLVWLVLWAGGILLCGYAVADTAHQVPGRLFTTPEERAMLDRLRAGKPDPKPPETAQTSSGAGSMAGPGKPVRVDGVVRRSRGPSTVWVDGEALPAGGRTADGVQVRPAGKAPGAVYLKVPNGERAVRLKPGQRYDPSRGVVTEAFQGEAE